MKGRSGFLKFNLVPRIVPVMIACLAAFVCLQGCATSRTTQTSNEAILSTPRPQPSPSVEERWGIKILSTRLTSHGYMVDLRYRIIDPERASVLFARGVTPYLLDEASGTKLSVPSMPVVGLLRAKVRPEIDREYFMLFGNSHGVVKKGNKVSVVAGDFKVDDLTVE